MRVLIPIAAALLVASAAQAKSPAAGDLVVTAAWSRPAVAGTNGAGFLTVANHGSGPESLTGATSPAAARVEIHSSSMTDGVMRMQKLARVAIPAGKTVTFAPGGHHLMLIGLKAPLKAGARVPATLTFASGARVTVSFEVRVTPPGPAAAADHRH